MQAHKGPIVMEMILGDQVAPPWLFRMEKVNPRPPRPLVGGAR